MRLHLNNQLSLSKSDFLLSKGNKQNILLMLGDELTKTGITVNHANGDADLLIAQTALKAAKDHPTVLIGDLLVLALIYLFLHCTISRMKKLFTLHMNKNRASSWQKFEISVMQSKFKVKCQGILVIHAFSGCDTTSRIHSVGKPAVLEKYRKSNQFQKLTTIFSDPSANKGDILNTGEQLMLSITGASKKEKTMDEKRLADYYKKLRGKSAVKFESLGPTSDATAKHSERVYHTGQSWCGNDLPPEKWG